jgi:hypothetical protein
MYNVIDFPVQEKPRPELRHLGCYIDGDAVVIWCRDNRITLRSDELGPLLKSIGDACQTNRNPITFCAVLEAGLVKNG